MQDVAKVDSNLPAALQGVAGLAQSIQAVGGDVDAGVSFMAFRKTGEWEYGIEDIEVDPEGTWLVNPAEFMHGWVAWDDNRSGGPVGELMIPAGQPLPVRGSLSDVGDGEWSKCVSIKMKAITGEDADDGAEAVFKTSSKGGLKAYSKLVADFLKHLGEVDTSKTDELYPVVKLAETSYKHPKYGKIFTPVMEVVGWANMDAEVEVEAEPEPEAKPAGRRRRVAR